MAKIITIERCSGLNHVHLTVERTGGGTFQRTFLMNDLVEQPEFTEEYVQERLKLLVRESQARGNSGYAAIRSDLLNREFVE